jgi:hypothetical protein
MKRIRPSLDPKETRERSRKTRMPSTSSVDAHMRRSHFEEENEDGHTAAPLDRDHRSGAAGAEGPGHHRGPRRDDGEAGSPPSGVVGACGVHSHRGHSSLGAWERATVHDSGPGDCIHGAQGTFGRIHPWEDRAGVESETGTGPGRDGLHGFGSGERDETGRWFLESELRGPEMSGTGEAGFLTSATQVTREPLNSCWSSFSTAVLRSFAVSNSTNLVPCQLGGHEKLRGRESLGSMARIVDDEPTLCLVRGRSRSRPHPVLTGGQSLSGPRKGSVSPGPGR